MLAILVFLTQNDHELKDEPGQNEAPPVHTDGHQHQEVHGHANPAENEHQNEDNDVGGIARRRVAIVLCVVNGTRIGHERPPQDHAEAGHEVDQDQDDAEDPDEGMEGAAAPAHLEEHVLCKKRKVSLFQCVCCLQRAAHNVIL